MREFLFAFNTDNHCVDNEMVYSKLELFLIYVKCWFKVRFICIQECLFLLLFFLYILVLYWLSLLWIVDVFHSFLFIKRSWLTCGQVTSSGDIETNLWTLILEQIKLKVSNWAIVYVHTYENLKITQKYCFILVFFSCNAVLLSTLPLLIIRNCNSLQ